MPTIAASAGVADVLTDLFIVLLAAKLGDELFRRLRQPTLIGEILAGLLVGPAVFGLVEPSEVLEVFAELGVVFLLFWVGLETKLSDLREVGTSAMSVGVLGVVIPFAGGIGARRRARREHGHVTVHRRRAHGDERGDHLGRAARARRPRAPHEPYGPRRRDRR